MQDLPQAALSQNWSNKAGSKSNWEPTDIAQRRRVQLVTAASAWKLVGARTCRAATVPMPQVNSARLLCANVSSLSGCTPNEASNKAATQR